MIEKQPTALVAGAGGVIGSECKVPRLAALQRREHDTGRPAWRTGAVKHAMRSAGHTGLLRAGVAIPALFVALPAGLFYWIAFRHLVNLPYADDYELLGFLNQLSQIRDVAAKLWLFLASQHNEYKLFFVDGAVWAQFAFLGHINFAQLSVLGDLAVLPLGLTLWWMFLPGHKDLARRLALFVPVAWLLFQMVYWQTLNAALGVLQNLWVIAFSLGLIFCVLRPARKAYIGGLFLYVLAISASGNGFFVLPVGLLIMVTRRQYARAAGLLALSALAIAAYAYHYNFLASQVQPGASVFSELRHWRPDFMVAFVGNAGVMAGHPVFVALDRLVPALPMPIANTLGAFVDESTIDVATCLALGILLLLSVGWMMWRGYAQRNPCVASSVLFILLTAAGVAGLRSAFGVAESLTSRYTIYGTLLLIFAWMAVAEEFLEHRSEKLLRNRVYSVTTVVVIVLALCMDRTGTRQLALRNSEIVFGMQVFEHPTTPGSTEGPALYGDPNDASFRAAAREVLNDSIRLGVYQPPRL